MPLPPYEAVPYDDYPVTETHVDTLYLAARRAGLPAARPEGARVLELGCAHAVNLMPMAFHLPDARFVGVDLSPGQIGRAQQRTEELGLTNLALHQADVMDLHLEGESFDYIIAHGLYSWVPEPVRARVFELCQQTLTEAGVAYVSYNAMPAWGVRGAVRKALRLAVGETTEVDEQLQRARAALEQLEQVQPLRGTAEGALLEHEFEALRDKPDAYLLHEYLSPHCRAFYLHEVVERAERAGLRFAGDVAPTGLSTTELSAAREGLSGALDDPMDVEQLVDIVTFRQFRASLWCRADAPRRAAPPPSAWMAGSRLAAASGEAKDWDPPATRRVLAHLGSAWPGGVELEALARALDMSEDSLGEVLEPLVDDQRVQLRPRPLPMRPAGPRPKVTALSRFEARHLPFVTTPRHEHAPLDSFHAVLIGHLDGHNDRAAVVEALIEDVHAGRLQLQGGAIPPVERLRAALPGLVEAGVQRLEAAGLIVG